MEDQGGGEAQGVADPQKTKLETLNLGMKIHTKLTKCDQINQRLLNLIP
jgi:hypothetical protein